MMHAIQTEIEAGRKGLSQSRLLKGISLLSGSLFVVFGMCSLRAQQLAPYLEAANHGPLLAYAAVPLPSASVQMGLIAPDLGCLKGEENLSHQGPYSFRPAHRAGTEAPATAPPTDYHTGPATSAVLSLSSPPSTELTTPETSVHLAYDNVQAIFSRNAGGDESADDDLVIVRARMGSRFAYQKWAKVETGYGQYLGPDTIARWRTNGAGVEDRDYLYVKLNVKF